MFTDQQETDHRKRRKVTCELGQSSASMSTAPSNVPEPINVDPGPQPPFPDQAEQNNGCPYCFQTVCVTALPNDFLGQGQAACDANHGLRRNIYNHYWKMIRNLGGWRNPRYLDHKQHVGGGEWVVEHRREIMPLCVLKQVRNLYPNPPSIPYMGHKWE